jgi:hypothetical protein
MAALSLLIVLTAVPQVGAAEPGLDFFESRIRPLLTENCYKCHSAEAKELKGSLLLDSKPGWMKGGENGPVIVPGDAKASRLLQAVKHESEDLKMPPKKKLSARAIADLERWIALGAPDPRGQAVAARPTARFDFAEARQHWAYRPIRSGEPGVGNQKAEPGGSSPIDSFIRAKLAEKNLAPAPPADLRVLIRRVYYDLTGLPPTFEEAEAFVNDTTPDAFARVVDRLLASPQFGERWARHWLDVARFAETKDLVLLYGRDRIRPYAYTYRDYVIRAFNGDLPVDQFITDQLAADQAAPKDQPWRLAAMGFLTLGRLFDNNPHDIYDDQIDTVSRGLLGLTVGCARCHDHKYDAITTADYYALYGVFASSEAPLDPPLLEDPAAVPGSEEFEKQLAAKRRELEVHIDQQFNEITETARERVGDYLIRVATEKAGLNENAVFYLSLSPEDLRPGILARWRRLIGQRAQPRDPIFGPWHDLSQIADGEFAAKAPPILERWQAAEAGISEGRLNPLIQRAIAEARFTNRADVARAYGAAFKAAYDESKKPAAGGRSSEFPEARGQLVALLTGRDGPGWFPKGSTYLHMSRVPRDKFGTLVTDLDKLAVHATNAPPARAMVLVDAPELHDPRVFLRGNPANPGEKIPRRFIEVLSPDGLRAFRTGSGRLELARAIVSAENPLTSRVFVNRVWMHLLGEPLVATPSDFGVRGTPPTHPGLLDHLASSFLQDGWSLKKLVRRIVLSETYRQSSDNASATTSDPDNHLLGRANRRRLDFESMRDTLLSVSGRLDRTMGGRSVDVAGDPQNRRRTIYGLVDRQDVPQVFRAFDFASPDQSAASRPQTIVPQQALFALNSPFVIEQARALAARVELCGDSGQRTRMLYQFIFARQPSAGEIGKAAQFTEAAAAVKSGGERSQLNPWQQFAQVLLLTNELMFVD